MLGKNIKTAPSAVKKTVKTVILLKYSVCLHIYRTAFSWINEHSFRFWILWLLQKPLKSVLKSIIFWKYSLRSLCLVRKVFWGVDMKKLVNSGFGKLLKISLKRFTDNILKDVFSVTQTDINEFSSNLQDRYNNVDRQICTHARTHIHMLACTCVHTHTSYWRRSALSECFF